MEKIPSFEANSRLAGQDILRYLWNSKIHHGVHKSPPLPHILNQINLVQTL
jgi:hypothetical protein